MLVADYLAVHAAIYGILTLGILHVNQVRLGAARILPLAVILVWGLALFGGVLDRYVANFFPTGPRISIIAAIALGTIPALLAEAALTQVGNATFLRKTAARLSFLGSLAIATALDFERLFFLLLILPLIALFYASFGVMGGHMQHQGHVQMVSRIFDYGQNPQEASDAPRWHVYPDLSVGLENGMPQSLLDGLKQRGHNVRCESQESVFGGAQLIQALSSGYVGASDHRKEGYVGGF